MLGSFGCDNLKQQDDPSCVMWKLRHDFPPALFLAAAADIPVVTRQDKTKPTQYNTRKQQRVPESS